MEKKIKQFCYISKKKFWVWKKKSNNFVTFREKKFWVWKEYFFLKCATQIKYRSNVFVTLKKKTVIRYDCITLNARSHSLIMYLSTSISYN